MASTKAIVTAARRLCDHLDYHNKNLNRKQEELYLELKEAVECYDKAKKGAK